MANLVSPGYKRSSLVNQVLVPYEERTIEFRGLNQRSAVEEGEMSDMLNLTSDNYPLLTPRKLRGTMSLPASVAKPLSIITKYDKMAMIAKKTNNNIAFYYDGTEIASVTGLSVNTRMVAINTKICFFPEKTYLTLTRSGDTVTIGAYGYLDHTLTNIHFTINHSPIRTGDEDAILTYDDYSGFAKDDILCVNGELSVESPSAWISDGTKKKVCDQSDGSGGKVLVPSGVLCTAIRQIGSSDFWVVAGSTSPFTFKAYRVDNDQLEYEASAIYRNGYYFASCGWHYPEPEPAVTFGEILSTADPIKVGRNIIQGVQITDLTCSVKSAGSTSMTLSPDPFVEYTGGLPSVLNGTIKRKVPNLLHVVEWNNRLWGVCDEDNTVYACKLGDPTNWQYYQGTSLDSYYAQQGTDGKWTGSAAYASHLIFFKQNSMTRIYGTAPKSFQIDNAICFGVEEGSSRSVAIINNIVYYKSTIGFMAYEGGTPYTTSNKLDMPCKNVVAGTDGQKYYASVEYDDSSHDLLVLDVSKAVWHREDHVRFRDCCTYDGKLYFISDEDAGAFDEDKIYIINPDTETESLPDRKWMAVFGPFDEHVESQKIFSKVSLRFLAQPKTLVTVYIKIDDGPWQRIKRFKYAQTHGETIPIVPRRCDRFSIKIEGEGDCEIKSLTRRYRRGSEAKYGHNQL